MANVNYTSRNFADIRTDLVNYVKQYYPDIFADFNDGEETRLPGINLEQVLDKMKKAYPAMKVDKPVYGKAVIVLQGK